MTQQSRSTGSTGMKDEHYDLVSVLYHSLQGAEEVGQYIQDAEEAGEQELAQYFRKVQEQYRQLAQDGKRLLGQHLNQ